MGSATPIGIVLVEFDKAEQQDFGAFALAAYIGTSAGLSKEMDEERIVKNGARFPVSAAKMMIGRGV
jgi:hypothetical protein